MSAAARASPLVRFTALAGGGALLVMTGRFGRSPVREAAYRLRDRRGDLDLKLSWRLFTNLVDWAERWPTEQGRFAAGLILTAPHDPVVERAVGRCLVDLYLLGKPLLWGVVSDKVRWCPRFWVSVNGWPPELILPHPADYARLAVARDVAEFCPQFDPILYTTGPDYVIFNSRLHWWEPRHSLFVVRRG